MNKDYPLYCVDRGDRVKDWQFIGPYLSHDDAHERAEEGDLIRRCRQLRPSEIAFNTDADNLADIVSFADELDQAAGEGNLPDGAWYSSATRVVHTKYDDGTSPTHLNYETWVDDHLALDAWICEGDE